MAKSKPQKLIPATAKRKKRSVAAELDLLDEDGWVVVKKQKVTIIIPPSPVSKKLIVPNAAGTHPPPMLTGSIDSQSELKGGVHSPVHSSGVREKPKSLTHEKTSQKATVFPQSISLIPPPPPPGHKHICNNNNNIINNNNNNNNHPGESHRAGVSEGWAYTDFTPTKMGKVSRPCSSTKMIKRLGIFADRSRLLNQRLRAVILEKKVKRAGGLSNWLVSLGLGHFIKIFQCRNVSKFELASLTMEKLKDMGAYAVGPRRKLLHAIGCLCQPYCIEHP